MSVEAIQETVTDTRTYEDVAAAGAGFMIPFVLDNLVTRYVPVDVPEEAVGLLAMGLEAGYAPSQYRTAMMMGSGAYTFDAAARRFGIKNTVTSLGA